MLCVCVFVMKVSLRAPDELALELATQHRVFAVITQRFGTVKGAAVKSALLSLLYALLYGKNGAWRAICVSESESVCVRVVTCVYASVRVCGCVCVCLCVVPVLCVRALCIPLTTHRQRHCTLASPRARSSPCAST